MACISTVKLGTCRHACLCWGHSTCLSRRICLLCWRGGLDIIGLDIVAVHGCNGDGGVTFVAVTVMEISLCLSSVVPLSLRWHFKSSASCRSC